MRATITSLVVLVLLAAVVVAAAVLATSVAIVRYAVAAEVVQRVPGPRFQIPDQIMVRLPVARIASSGLAQPLPVALPGAAAMLTLGSMLLARRVWLRIGQWRQSRTAVHRLNAHHCSVRLVRLAHDMIRADGQRQADGTVYPGTRTLSVYAALDVPAAAIVSPNDGSAPSALADLEVGLRLLAPFGSVARTIFRRPEYPNPQRASVVFDLADAGDLFGSSAGTWTAQIIVGGSNRCIGELLIPAVTPEAMIADLELTDATLLATDNHGELIPVSLALTDTEALIPTFTLRPRTLDAARFGRVPLQLELVNLNGQHPSSAVDVMLTLKDGQLQLRNVIHPITGADLAHRPGRWAFRLKRHATVLGTLEFTLITKAQALAALRVESLDVVATPADGSAAVAAGPVVYRSETATLAPVVVLRSAYPSPLIGYDVVIGLACDGEPTCFASDQIMLRQPSLRVVPGEWQLNAPAGASRAASQCEFVVLVNGRRAASRVIEIHRRRPRVADVQGRLRTDGDSVGAECDIGAEADRLARSAQVCG